MDPNDYFFAWKPLIFRQKTRGWTTLQRGIYRELIDEYMITREPLPVNDHALAEIARVNIDIWLENKEVILRKFEIEGEFLYHAYCNEELGFQDEKSKKRSNASKKAALKRWKHKKKPIMRLACEGDAIAMPKNATGQDRTGQDNYISPTPFKIPDFVNPDIWHEFEKHRAKKKSPMTEHAKKLAVKDLEKLKAEGHDPTDVINQSILRGWTGLFPIKTQGENYAETRSSGNNGNKSHRAKDAIRRGLSSNTSNPER